MSHGLAGAHGRLCAPVGTAAIIETAYELFSRQGLRAIGVDRIIYESGVARKTFYRHFPSKVDLILAFLDLRGQRWAYDWLRAEMRRLGETPAERWLAVFDVFDEWFHRDDFESCALIATVFEIRDRADPVHQRAARQIDVVKDLLLEQARLAGIPDPEALVDQIHILMMGAIASATRGDVAAARRAREVAQLILDEHELR